MASSKQNESSSNGTNSLTSQMQDLQTQLLNHWQDSLDTTLQSWGRMTALAGAAIGQLAEQHNRTLDHCTQPVFCPFNFLDHFFDMNHTAVRPCLDRRIALVTGGIGGIGTAICKRLSDDDHHVIAAHHPAEAKQAKKWQRERRAAGYELELLECDVASFESCEALAVTIKRRYGRIDILVNGAGITRDATLRKMDPEKWHAVLDTNLDSVFNVTRNLIDLMLKQDYGRIINIASVNGQKGQFGQTNYSAAKAGMIGFTKALALELADTGITVNTISPGYVATPMVEAIPEDIKQGIIRKIPVGRLGKPAEIAEAVAFLARDESGYITGSDIAINGGLYMGYK
jgi:acetoacetyl-CoA reductase